MKTVPPASFKNLTDFGEVFSCPEVSKSGGFCEVRDMKKTAATEEWRRFNELGQDPLGIKVLTPPPPQR